MTRIELALFDRFLDHLQQYEVPDRRARVGEIIQALSVLEYNPLLGRPARDEMRELVIGRQSRGYVALYRYITEIDTVFVLAIRNQREAGYRTL